MFSMILWLTKYSSVSSLKGFGLPASGTVTELIGNRKINLIFLYPGDCGLHIQTLWTKLFYDIYMWGKDRKTQIWDLFLDRLCERQRSAFSYWQSKWKLVPTGKSHVGSFLFSKTCFPSLKSYTSNFSFWNRRSYDLKHKRLATFRNTGLKRALQKSPQSKNIFSDLGACL